MRLDYLLLCHLQDALQRVPSQQREAYEEALISAPNVVQNESNPLHFLRAEGGNPSAAALRLCRYWQERKRTFGQRGLLPILRTLRSEDGMDQCYKPGEAFEAQDLDAIQQASTVMLPPDTAGCSVLLFDPSRISNELMESNEIRLRALFYTLHCAAQNPHSQTDGLVLIVRLVTNTGGLKTHPSLDLVHDILGALICHAFPLSVKGLHLVACVDTGGSSSDNNAASTWIQQVLPMRQAQWETSFRRKAILHIAASPTNLVSMLQMHGLTVAGLPETLGGSWEYEHDTQKQPASRKRLASPSFASQPQTIKTRTGEDGEGSLSAFRQEQMNQGPMAQVMRVAAAMPSSPPPALSRNASEDILFNDTPTMRQLGLARLREAMMTLPDERRAAYFEAMVVCPDLVQAESDPIRFLRYEHYNAWAAARRLARFWEKRKLIFGSRAFLPMTMTGDGALSPEDIAHLESGYISLMPRDMQGRTVICLDASRRVLHSKESRMRLAFYWSCVMCENAMSQRDGYVLIIPLGMASFNVSPFDNALKHCVDIVVECFPTKAKNMHLVHYLPQSGAGRRRTLLQMVMPMLLAAMGRMLDRERTVMHPTESREAILTSFAKYGLHEHGLPEGAAGTYKIDNFYTWRRERCEMERQKYGLGLGLQYQPNEHRQLTTQATNAAPAYRSSLLERLLCCSPQVEPAPAAATSTTPGPLLATAAAALTGTSLATTAAGPSARQASDTPTAVASVSSMPVATVSGNGAMASSIQAQQDMAQIDYMIRRLPEREKAAYCEAMRRAPHLVETESNATAFCARDTWQIAARRLAMYWTVRKELFGSTQAFLPMTQTGEGALSRSDLVALSTGFFVCVPTKRDHQSLLCYDASKVGKTDRQCRLRVAFYMFAIASERRCHTQQQQQQQPGGGSGEARGPGGFVVLAHGLAEHHRQQDKEDLERVLDAMPGQVNAIHILRVESGGAPRQEGDDDQEPVNMDTAVLEMRRKFGKYGDEKCIVHAGTSKDEICEQLKPYGLFRECLPKSLGGTFGYDRFVQWQELRTRYEWGLPAGAKDEEAVDVYDFSGVQPLSALSETDRKERKRRMNVVHSRRKRERERIEIEVLQEQCLELRDAQKGLLAQNDHLQSLFSRVDACLGGVRATAESSPQG